MTGILAPAMVMAVAMGVEVTSWSVRKVELQRIADISAWAGARQYMASNNAQSATQTAADLAEINGVTSAVTRTWSAATLTTTDSLITAQAVPGLRNPAGKAIKVTVKRSILKTFSRIFPSDQPLVMVSAVAIAEVVTSLAGPQPCLLALKGDGSGVTTGTDITLTGSASITADNCSIRSDAGISLSGSSSLHVAGTYAGGAITTSGSATITGGTHPNAGQIDDPYATFAPLQTAFSSLGSGGTAGTYGGVATATLNPGTYASLNIGSSAVVTLNPGLYIVNGNVAFNGAARITGSGVTIVSSGSMAFSGSATVAITAPDIHSVAGGIPGMLFASKSVANSSFTGGSSVPFAGVIYYPNGNFTFSGSSSGSSSGCTQVIAGTITITGSSNLSAHCDSYGTLSYGSLPSTSAVALVR